MWTPFVVFAQPRDLRVEHSAPGRYRRRGLVRCAFVIAVCASLAACRSVPSGGSDAERRFAVACGALPTAHAGFLIYATLNNVDARTREIEGRAYAAASAICAGPVPRDLNSAIAALNRALATMVPA